MSDCETTVLLLFFSSDWVQLEWIPCIPETNTFMFSCQLLFLLFTLEFTMVLSFCKVLWGSKMKRLPKHQSEHQNNSRKKLYWQNWCFPICCWRIISVLAFSECVILNADRWLSLLNYCQGVDFLNWTDNVLWSLTLSWLQVLLMWPQPLWQKHLHKRHDEEGM